MKRNTTNIVLILIFLIGLSLLLYPVISNYWNSLHQSRAITEYSDIVQNMDDEETEKMLRRAEEYNDALKNRPFAIELTDEESKTYKNTLDITGTGIMGYIEIPAIKCSLPIYHGTDGDVLQVAIGHLTGTSLPVGGIGTHCVISGHRGLPSAKLFTDIDKLVEGDIFVIRTLDRIVTYEVDRIRIVLPSEMNDLRIDANKDLCTLVTCTPYGINTHRLLVRGHRVENTADVDMYVTSEAMQVETAIVALFIAVPILIILIIIMLIKTSAEKNRNRRK